MFISLMTEQTEATEIKMNMRNINVITARVVPDKNVSDDFMHAVLSNCTTKIVFLLRRCSVLNHCRTILIWLLSV